MAHIMKTMRFMHDQTNITIIFRQLKGSFHTMKYAVKQLFLNCLRILLANFNLNRRHRSFLFIILWTFLFISVDAYQKSILSLTYSKITLPICNLIGWSFWNSIFEFIFLKFGCRLWPTIHAVKLPYCVVSLQAIFRSYQDRKSCKKNKKIHVAGCWSV